MAVGSCYRNSNSQGLSSNICCSCMRRADLILSIQKSKIVTKKVRFLGHVIGIGTICTDPDKMYAIKNYRRPKTVGSEQIKNLRSKW